MTRYALYFSPAPESLWWRAGCQWLGRDPATGAECVQPSVPGMPHLLLAKLTSDARRYGFHATMKAPFRLASGFTETHLLSMAQAFCAAQHPIAVGPLDVRLLSSSLVLAMPNGTSDVSELAMRCVNYFDLLRAAPREDEQKKYRDRGLNARQEALLQRWGYPYTDDEFRFHLTLTDSLADVPRDVVSALQAAAQAHFAKAQAREPLHIDALTIFREDEPGSPFVAWQRVPFNTNVQHGAVPVPGKLIYIVGTPDTARDPLLHWAREHMPLEHSTVFAQRTITRAALTSEPHEPVDEATFCQLAQDGHFSMLWQANGLCYGIRRSIEVDLMVGRNVIVNGMHEYLPQLRRTFPNAQVIWLNADDLAVLQDARTKRDAADDDHAKRMERRSKFSMSAYADNGRRENEGLLPLAGQRLLKLISARH